MSVVLRFAPSPTGRLHVGNARAALVNFLFARRTGGRFMLRLDDTDAERNRDEYADAIQADLRWLGLDWADMWRQSDRMERYQAAIETLKDAGRLYPCYETPEELALQRRTLLSRGLPPIYDRAALRLTPADRQTLESQGRTPHWRFRLDGESIAWDDLVHGHHRFEVRNLADPVLIRADGRPLYAICSVVDDIDTGITHIVRGEDHITNSATQIQMFEALGAKAPRLAHLALLTGGEGDKLAKRTGALSLSSLREQGIEPMALCALLARLGTSDPVAPAQSLEELAAGFDFGKFSRAATRFDPAELERLNARILHDLPFEAVRDRLAAMGLADIDADFWQAVRPNISRLSDVAEWRQVALGPIDPVITDAGFAAEAARHLPPAPWDEATWGAWTGAVKGATGRGGKALFLPLRLALTGRDHGPELKQLLPLIGPDRARRRLEGQAA